jgi:hypothetical protein
VIARLKPLRVLPCFDSRAWTPSIAALRSMVGVDLLSFASGSTLVYRALSDEPEAIVIATEDLGTVAWRNDNDLIDVLSSTPTVFAERSNSRPSQEASCSPAYSLRPSFGADIGSIARCNPRYGDGPGSHIGAVRTIGRYIYYLK